jgi:hypothetical protein
MMNGGVSLATVLLVQPFELGPQEPHEHQRLRSLADCAGLRPKEFGCLAVIRNLDQAKAEVAVAGIYT